MTFLQVSLLAGLVAAGIPIALHLIARREPQKVVFGSIAFLTRHYASNRSKMQLRRWWLLLLRVLALVLLTLALASPVIGSSLVSQWNAALVALVLAIGFLAAGTIAFLRGLSKQLALGLAAVGGLLVALSLGSGAYLAATGPVVRGSSGGPIAVAVLVDNGPLSNLRSGDRIALDRDRETAQALIERLPRGSEWVIVDRSTVPANLTSDPAALAPRLESLKARHLAVDFRTRFGEARRALERSPLASKHVVILADRAKPTWESWIEADSGSTRGRTEKNRKASETAETGETSGTGETPQAIETSQTREVAPAGTDLHWVVAGRPPGLRTVSIVEAKLSDPLPAPEVPLRMTVTLRQQGDGRDQESDNPVQNVSVQVGRFPPDASLPLVRDGKLIRPEPEWVDRKSIALLPNQEATLDLTVPPLELGSHTIVLEVADPDDLLIDQQRFLTLAVRQPPEILVVAADEDSSFVLGQTLDPFAGQNQVGSPVASILERDLPITDLSPFAAIALADPTPEILNDAALKAFLDRGGLVMVALGPRVANATDPTVPSETLPAWLPTPKRVWRRTEPPTFFSVTDPTSPLTSALAADTPWNEFPVRQYWQVETSDQDRVPIRMAGTDHPALVRRSLESGGTVLLTSTPIPALDERSAQWNDLFGLDPWPIWLLTRQSVLTLADRDRAPMQFAVGESVSVPLETETDDSDTNDSDSSDVGGPGMQAGGPTAGDRNATRQVLLFPPDASQPLPLRSDRTTQKDVTFQVDHAGVYWLRGRGLVEASKRLGVAVNLRPATMSLEQVDQASIEAALRAGLNPDAEESLTVVDDPSELDLASDRSSGRYPLQSPVLLMVLAVFLAEQVLSNRLYR